MLDGNAGNAGNANTDFSRARNSPALSPSPETLVGTSVPAPAPHQAHCPPRQERQLPCCLGSGSSTVTSPSDLLSRQCRCMTGLQTSALVGTGQQDQTCKVQWQIREHLLSHWELAVTLLFASEIVTSHTHLHRSYGPTVPLGFSSEVFHWSQRW